MNNVKSYYEREAPEYEREFYREKDSYPTLQYRHEYILKRIKEADIPDDAKILDAGCGPGEMLYDLMMRNWELWGIDIAEGMIDIAKTKIAGSNATNKVHLSTGDVEKLEFDDNSFDLVICSGLIEYLQDDTKWPLEVSRVLKPGGILIINITNKYSVKNWTASFVEKLKKSKFLFNFMNFVKQKILKRGKLHHFPFRPRLHSPKQFDRFLASNGFEKLSHNYFSFSILPAPFDTLFGFITIPIRKYLEKFTERNMIIHGTGYIVTARFAEKT